MTHPAPPRLALRMLEALLPEESREVVIGDLAEAFDRDSSGSVLLARLTFWREAIVAVLRLQFVPEKVTAYVPAIRESIVQSFLSDVRQAVRVLGRARGFVALCVATLGGALAATAVIASVSRPMLLQPIPYPGADRLVMVNERAADSSPFNVGYATYVDLRRGAHSLAASAAFGSWEPTLFGGQESERVRGLRVTWEYFRTLGVRPVIGRDFEAADDTPDGNGVVILSHGLWMRRFGGDPAVVGRTIDLGTTRPRVIGVMPATFENVVEPTAQLWRALGYADQPYACRNCRHLRMVARVRDGVPIADAALELDGVMKRMAAAEPATYPGAGTVTQRLGDRVTQNTRGILVAIVAATAMLLLIAIANVVNLQLARAARRDEEFAVRAALGAGRGRIARQLLAEGLVLAVIAGVVGVVLAALALPTIVANLPATLPRVESVRLDWTVVAVLGGLVLLVAVAMGLVPAFRTREHSLVGALRAGGRTGGTPHHRLRVTLVVAEIGLALMLLVGASLLGRSLVRLLSVDLGFDPAGLVTMEVQATGPSYATDESVFANHDRIRAAVRAVPGVKDVGITSQLPLGGGFDRYGIRDRDNPAPQGGGYDADRYTVSWDYVRAMRVPIRRGRTFTEAEANDPAASVVLVSEALARRMWPGGDAVGRRIRIGGGEPARWFEVIGVVADARHAGLDDADGQQVYVPERQWLWADAVVALVVRVSGDPARTIPAIREAVRSVDPQQPVARIATMDQVIARASAQRSLGLILFGAFGGVALLLAAGGVYGVLAAAVAERTREFGVRTALGASPWAIMAMVLRQGGLLVLAGLVGGGTAAALLSRQLQSLLFEVQPRDPLAIAIGAGVVAVIALVACLVPARRATRVDPLTALRAG